MSLRYGILGFLTYGPQTGYDLSKAFYDSIDFFWHASTSQIYRELHAMEADGWVQSASVLQTDKPNKRLYSITPKGKEAFLGWLSAPQEGAMYPIRSVFLLRVFFSGGLPAGQARAHLRAFEQQAHQALLNTTDWHETADRYALLVQDEQDAVCWRLAADFGRRYYEMCARWAKDAQATLAEMEG